MPASGHMPFHILEKVPSKAALAAVEREFGHEGGPVVASHSPRSTWLSDVEAIVLLSTVIKAIPQVPTKERKHGPFIHLNSVLGIEAALQSEKTSERR